uniref:Glycoprotein nmb n=1 Tax=Cyclopterus lumpus TaxID=8103 RepID=A0A8C3ADD9_CYCLU
MFVSQFLLSALKSPMSLIKHVMPGKSPYPIPPIPGWDPDTNPWDDYLYPPLNPKPKELMHHKGKPKVHLTSDSPALNGSNISFTAKLEYPPCQKEDANGDIVWDEHCEDANGQVRSGDVYNLYNDYGFGKCTDMKKCNVFPDGKPFPQSSDWSRKSYVYVWHAMGQYFETCDGSSSSLTINTTNIPLGAEVIEVMVYKKRERRKYSPLTTDNTIFYVTDKIPVAVSISQKAAVNQSENVFFRGEDVVFKVQLHDPSGYLKTAAAIDYIWDFRDGNQLVTHRNVTTHAYSTLGSMNVKLVVEAAFPVQCPPTSPLPSSSSSPTAVTTGLPTTEPLSPTVANATPGSNPTTLAWLRTRNLNGNECYRYAFGTFMGNITIVGLVVLFHPSSFHPLILSIPTSACTIVSDPTCTQVRSIVCDDVPPSSECEVHLRRTFPEPGTYCINITLENSRSLTRTTISFCAISPTKHSPLSRPLFHSSPFPRRYKVYRPIRKSLLEDASGGHAGAGGRMVRLREALFPASEESHYLLTERRPV